MLTIQEAHTYMNIISLGIEKPMKCMNDEDHPDLISWVEDDEVMFMCLACSFKLRPGYKTEKHIRSVNKKFTN